MSLAERLAKTERPDRIAEVRGRVQKALIDGFQANAPFPSWPEALTKQLAAEKYSQDSWNLRLP